MLCEIKDVLSQKSNLSGANLLSYRVAVAFECPEFLNTLIILLLHAFKILFDTLGDAATVLHNSSHKLNTCSDFKGF